MDVVKQQSVTRFSTFPITIAMQPFEWSAVSPFSACSVVKESWFRRWASSESNDPDGFWQKLTTLIGFLTVLNAGMLH
jgi:hypothetical protein